MLHLAEAAGLSRRIVALSWKIRSEPDAVIGGYAEAEGNGLGPFHFYYTSKLEDRYADLTPAGARLRAMRIENELSPCRLDAATALRAQRQGIEIGPLVVVMGSVRT
ncbi:hypothetical protein ASPCAL00265 [Aspergillus calidoustus]|uniref:Uncharacterized protein n=1 Tax=Aspergillus calidoustus TaxID=454130 RepID=A0A0U5FN09_ASPCI|nr:hypothetical protein ASPCAL00265 [Aspergillus calidoustus]